MCAKSIAASTDQPPILSHQNLNGETQTLIVWTLLSLSEQSLGNCVLSRYEWKSYCSLRSKQASERYIRRRCPPFRTRLSPNESSKFGFATTPFKDLFGGLHTSTR